MKNLQPKASLADTLLADAAPLEKILQAMQNYRDANPLLWKVLQNAMPQLKETGALMNNAVKYYPMASQLGVADPKLLLGYYPPPLEVVAGLACFMEDAMSGYGVAWLKNLKIIMATWPTCLPGYAIEHENELILLIRPLTKTLPMLKNGAGKLRHGRQFSPAIRMNSRWS